LLWQKNAPDTEFFVTSFIPFWLRGDLIAFQQQDVGIIDLKTLNGSEYVRAKTAQRTPKKVQTNALFQINHFSLYQKNVFFLIILHVIPRPKKVKILPVAGIGKSVKQKQHFNYFPYCKSIIYRSETG